MIDTLYLSDSSCVDQSYTAKSAYVINVEERPASTLFSAYDKTRALIQARALKKNQAICPVLVGESGGGTYARISPDEYWVASPTTSRSLLDWNLFLKSLSPDSILQHASVKDFLQMERATDFQALEQMYKLVKSEFGSDASYEYELIADDGEEPYLILSVSTNGLDMHDVVEKEMRVFEVIARSDVLSSANKYHVISAI